MAHGFPSSIWTNTLYANAEIIAPTITGGTNASNDLTLRSTSSATKGNVVIDDNTNATSSTTGSLVVNGGVGIASDLYVGGIVYGDAVRLIQYKDTQQSVLTATNTAVHTWTTVESSSGWTENTLGVGSPFWRVPVNGIYQCMCEINWTGNATGTRAAYFSLAATPSATTPLWSRILNLGSASGNYTTISATFRIITTDALYLLTYQTSGISLNVPSVATDFRDRLDFSCIKISD